MEYRDVEFGEHPIHGTLIHPQPDSEALQPALLIIAGSGAIDRNGNNPDQSINLYNQLAEVISESGFVTLRYDKRGTGRSGGDYMSTGLWDLVADAKEAFRYLKEQSFVDKKKVFVIGHSEGAMLATEVAKDEDIAGLILLSGAAETLHEAMLYQRGKVIETFQAATGIKGLFFKVLRMVRRVDKQGKRFDQQIKRSQTNTIRAQGSVVNARWFREHFEYDVKESLKQVTCPVLAVGGEKDLQSAPEKVFEVEALVQGETDAQIIPKMNHMLREQEGDYTILQLPKAYKGIGEKPLSTRLITTLESWLKRHA